MFLKGAKMEKEELERQLSNALMRYNTSEPEDRAFTDAFKDITRLSTLGSAEAMYYRGHIILYDERMAESLKKRGITKLKTDKRTAWLSICQSAEMGYVPAKRYLDNVCSKRYRESFPAPGEGEIKGGPLRDFDGKEIKINRTGKLFPVDAVLEYKDGRNILTLSCNVRFLLLDEIKDAAKRSIFRRSVIEGIKAWEGSYTVFGGQKVEVRMIVSDSEQRAFDNVYVMPLTKNIDDELEEVMSDLGEKEREKRVKAMYERTIATAIVGNRLKSWSVTSRKFVIIRERGGDLGDAGHIKEIMKHEFGHVLGLGDLYMDEELGLGGVDAEKYPELISYKLYDSYYNLVMCNASGPISNNDIEMVILAFSENRLQAYQTDGMTKCVSKALGRGN